VCPGALTYKVWRSTTTPVSIVPANVVAAGLTGTSYVDSTGLANGTTYSCVVRAVDGSNGLDDGNTTENSGVPYGPVSSSTITDTFEGSLSGGGFDVAGWTKAIVSGSTNWARSTVRKHDGTHSWFSADGASTGDRVLVSPSFGVIASTTLSFWHTFKFEGTSTCYDGGTLEVSTNGGTTWTVVPDAAFTAGGSTGAVYTGCSNPIAGKRAWCFGTIGTMTQVSVNLGGTYSGATAQIRWHEGDDSSTAGTGWYVDTVVIANAGTASACATGVSGPKPAPEGGAGKSPLRASKSGANVAVTWDASCAVGNYNLYHGAIGSWGAFNSSSPISGQCGIGTTGTATLPIGGDSWWIVAGTAGNAVSSFGKSLPAAEQAFSGWGSGGLCPSQTTKDTSGTCP
jgi:hypothetical protein